MHPMCVSVALVLRYVQTGVRLVSVCINWQIALIKQAAYSVAIP